MQIQFPRTGHRHHAMLHSASYAGRRRQIDRLVACKFEDFAAFVFGQSLNLLDDLSCVLGIKTG